MGAYERATTLLAQAQDGSVPHSVSSELAAICRMLKRVLDQYSSPTQVGNSPNATPSPESPTASARSSGTDSEMGLTSMPANLEILIPQLLRWYGQIWDGPETLGKTKLLLDNLFTATIHIATCVKDLATAQTTMESRPDSQKKQESRSTSSRPSNINTSRRFLHTADGKLTLTIDCDDWAALSHYLAERGGSSVAVPPLPPYAKPLPMTLNLPSEI